MTLQEQIEILQAALAGKEVQWQEDERGLWLKWMHVPYDFVNYRYRIAPDPPEKKVRPWNAEECAEMVGKVLIPKNNPLWRVTVLAGGDSSDGPSVCIFISNRVEFMSADSALYNWTMLDGSPCGVIE